MWGYGDPIIEGDDVNDIVHAYNRGTIESYWFPERQILLDGYRTIDFPFDETEPPSFSLEQRWTLSELAGYLRTWSATARYAAELGADPIVALEEKLSPVWGDVRVKRLVSWPLYVRAGIAA